MKIANPDAIARGRRGSNYLSRTAATERSCKNKFFGDNFGMSIAEPPSPIAREKIADHDLLWQAVQKRVPGRLSTLKQMLKDLGKSSPAK